MAKINCFNSLNIFYLCFCTKYFQKCKLLNLFDVSFISFIYLQSLLLYEFQKRAYLKQLPFLNLIFFYNYLFKKDFSFKYNYFRQNSKKIFQFTIYAFIRFNYQT